MCARTLYRSACGTHHRSNHSAGGGAGSSFDIMPDIGRVGRTSTLSVTVLQPPFDRALLSGLGFVVSLVAVEPHSSGRAAPAPFAQLKREESHRPDRWGVKGSPHSPHVTVVTKRRGRGSVVFRRRQWDGAQGSLSQTLRWREIDSNLSRFLVNTARRKEL